MEIYRVDISAPAEKDLRDIAKYISSQLSAPLTAMKMLEAIEEAIEGLSVMPQSRPPVIDERLFALGYHKLIVKNYIVFFSINAIEKVVDVERILHARRDWLYLL